MLSKLFFPKHFCMLYHLASRKFRGVNVISLPPCGDDPGLHHCPCGYIVSGRGILGVNVRSWVDLRLGSLVKYHGKWGVS